MYELVVQLLDPYTFLLGCLAASMIWVWRRQLPRGRPLVAATILLVLLCVLSTQAAGFLALRSLERSYPPTYEVPRATDTIVVLSGGVFLDDDTGTSVRLGQETVLRCLHAARLYKQAGRCRMILSGGKIDWSSPGPAFSEVMRKFMIELGVHADDIVVENRSSTTYENALYSKLLLPRSGDARIFLVTEASHMYRSEHCFRAQGVEVIPAPCDHHALHWEFLPGKFLPSSHGISQISRAAHEYLGIVWYILRRRI